VAGKGASREPGYGKATRINLKIEDVSKPALVNKIDRTRFEKLQRE